jgi:hypothetical protein
LGSKIQSGLSNGSFTEPALIPYLHVSHSKFLLPSSEFLYSFYSLNFVTHFISSYHFTSLQWGLAIFAAFGLGMSKTGFLGIALLAVALMAEMWPARESTGVILPMLVFADFFALFFFRATRSGGKSGACFRRP